MLTLPNVATSDSYTAACTLGPVATAQRIVYVVANAAALARIAPLQPNGTLGDFEQDEILLTPQSNVLERAGGIQFRSAVAGVPAQIVAQLITPADPVPGAGTPFTAKLSGSGSVSPGTAAVQIQKNGALIGTEPILDFLDGAGFVWTLADDAANTRVTAALASPVLSYTEFTAAVGAVGTTPGTATTVVTPGALAFDGAAYWFEFFAPRLAKGTNLLDVSIWIDGVEQGELVQCDIALAPGAVWARKLTPAAGAHTPAIKAYSDGGTGFVYAGNGAGDNFVPGWFQIRRA